MKIAVLNVKGLNVRVKVTKTLNHLINEKCILSFLTKIHRDDHLKYECNRRFADTTIVMFNADRNNSANVNFVLLNL